jgi:phosphate/sulfate permease
VTAAQTVVVVGAALTAVVVWNVVTWRWGLPSSSSPALVGGLVGAAVVEAGSTTQVVSSSVVGVGVGRRRYRHVGWDGVARRAAA